MERVRHAFRMASPTQRELSVAEVAVMAAGRSGRTTVVLTPYRWPAAASARCGGWTSATDAARS